MFNLFDNITNPGYQMYLLFGKKSYSALSIYIIKYWIKLLMNAKNLKVSLKQLTLQHKRMMCNGYE